MPARGKPFAPGNKLGRGRPRGSRNKTTLLAQELLDSYAEPLVRKCLHMALQADPKAMQLCMDRILPARRDLPVKIGKLPMSTAAELSKVSEMVLQKVASGQITVTQGLGFSELIENRRGTIETVEVDARVRALLKGELHPGEHPAIIDLPLWREVQERLKAGKRSRLDQAGQPQDALLRGLLFCEACGTPMVPACTTKKNRRHRYYACLSAQKKGWKTCPSRALPARRIEDSVIERLGQLRPLGADPARSPDRRYLMENLVERVTYHGGTGQVRITLTKSGPLPKGGIHD